MNELSVLRRKEAVLSALQENPKIKNYNIDVVPINGSGDMEIHIKRNTKFKGLTILSIDGVVKHDQEIDHLKKDLLFHT